MPVEAVLIIGPAIDFATLLSLTHEALGYNIAGAADASPRKLSDTEKFLICLAALKDESTELTLNLLSHVSFSVLVIADERDLLDILERTSGISFVRAATTVPNVNVAVLSGTLSQWRNAVAAGTNEDASVTTRACYSKILLLFDRAGLTSVWDDFERRTAPDRSGFLLEDKRKP
ncbi:MAG: hypothetical protein ABFC63_04820 [Thermoguttaceae bacterium]